MKTFSFGTISVDEPTPLHGDYGGVGQGSDHFHVERVLGFHLVGEGARDPSSQTLVEGETDWIPTPISTAETWLECVVATTSSARARARISEARTDRQAQEMIVRELLADYETRMANSLPRLSAADEADQRRAFKQRYDDPEELEAARWRSDACVIWLQGPA